MQGGRSSQTRINILLLAHLLPFPLDSGGKIKSFHYLKALSRKYDVTLLSFIRSKNELRWLDELRPFCKKIETCTIKRSKFRDIAFAIKSFTLGRSFVVSRDYVGKMVKMVDALLNDGHYHIMHVERLQMAQFVPESFRGVMVLDESNVEWKVIQRISQAESWGPKKLFAALEYHKLRRYELEICNKADLVLTVTEQDRKTLSSSPQGAAKPPVMGERRRGFPVDEGVSDSKFVMIPVGVDCNYFSYSWVGYGSGRLVFVGTMYWPPNIDSVLYFYNEIYPLIAKNGTLGLKLQIVGSRPSREVRNLAKRNATVEVTGFVKDVRPYMKNGAIFIVPLRSGSGMRVKILNAMASGIPVVSTSIGCEGIEGLQPVVKGSKLVSEPNIWIADTPEDFAEAAVTLMENEKLAMALSVNGRKLMEERYDWKSISRKILDVYGRMERHQCVYYL